MFIYCIFKFDGTVAWRQQFALSRCERGGRGGGGGGGHWEQRGIGVCVSCLLLFNCCYDIILGRGGEGGWGEVCVFIC